MKGNYDINLRSFGDHWELIYPPAAQVMIDEVMARYHRPIPVSERLPNEG